MRILAPVILGVAMPFLAMVPETSIAQEPYETTEVADGVYRFRWQAHNGLFVIGRGDAGTQALVIDPISVEAGAQLALEILSIAPDAELVGIVYSHHHADHATGAEAVAAEFGGEIPIIAHANAEAPIRSGGDPALPPPTVTFTDRATVMVSDRRLRHLLWGVLWRYVNWLTSWNAEHTDAPFSTSGRIPAGLPKIRPIV